MKEDAVMDATRKAADDFDMIAEGALAELTDRAYQESFKNDPDFYALIQHRMEREDRLAAVLKGLCPDDRAAVESYVAIVNDCSAHLMKGMYLRGAKDCILLLDKFPQCR
jgi:hypothetical protein